MNRTKLYLLLFTLCMAGYVWLALVKFNVMGLSYSTTCLIKNVTHLPCPSCGATRSVIAIFGGNILQALQWNPFGFIIAVIMLVAPVWIIGDVLRNKQTLWNTYKTTETKLQRPIVSLPLIALVLINWAWNIYKEL